MTFPKLRPGHVKIVIAAAVLLSFLLGGTLLIIRFSESPDIKKDLARANEFIVLGEYDSALGILSGIVQENPNPRSVREYLRLHLAIASSTGDYARLLRASGKAIEGFGDNPDYWKYRVLAESRLGLHDAALQHADDFLDKRCCRHILTEVALAAERRPEPEEIPEDYSLVLNLLETEDPSLFIQARDAYDLPDLTAVAAILTAQTDSTEEAFALLDGETTRKFLELSMHLAYDAEKFDIALELLNSSEDKKHNSDFTLLKGDIYLLNGLYSSAAEVYKRCILNWPNASYIPYHNVSRLTKDSEKAEGMLLEGLSRFPGNRQLRMSLITFLLEEGRDDEAGILLYEYLDDYPEDAYAGILADYLAGLGKVPEVKLSRLWMHLGESPESGEWASSYAAWYFAAAGRFDELEVFLQRTRTRQGKTPWHYTFSGISEALKGRYDTSADAFREALELEESPENLYNCALLEGIEGNRDDSISLLTKALMLAGTDDVSAEHTAIIGTELARQLADAGYRQEALEQLREAIDADPGNLEAKRLEKELGHVKEGYQ